MSFETIFRLFDYYQNNTNHTHIKRRLLKEIICLQRKYKDEDIIPELLSKLKSIPYWNTLRTNIIKIELRRDIIRKGKNTVGIITYENFNKNGITKEYIVKEKDKENVFYCQRDVELYLNLKST